MLLVDRGGGGSGGGGGGGGLGTGGLGFGGRVVVGLGVVAVVGAASVRASSVTSTFEEVGSACKQVNRAVFMFRRKSLFSLHFINCILLHHTIFKDCQRKLVRGHKTYTEMINQPNKFIHFKLILYHRPQT